MKIISFPVNSVNYSHNLEFFSNLGFEIINTGIEGSYIKLPEGWSANFQYHTPFEFFITIYDPQRRLRASAILLGNTAKVELLPRYKIINYKPWLSPDSSQLRLVDNTNGYVLFAQNYFPKLVPNKANNDLLTSYVIEADDRSYESAYNKLIAFCNEHNINVDSENPLEYW